VAGGLAIVGDSCIDMYLGDPPRAAVGGNALNVAVNLAHRGFPCRYIGEIGNDENGRHIRNALEKAGVGHEGLHERVGSTWVVSLSLGDGDTVVEREDPGVTGLLALTPQDLLALSECRHVHLANLVEPAGTLAGLADLGVHTSYDFGSTFDIDTVGPTDVAFFSGRASEGESGAMRTARAAVGRGVRLAVVTLGPGGSLAFDGENTIVVPVDSVEPVDTLGAGDSYIATFLAEQLSGVSLEAAMASANRHAAATCLHWAAWPQQPLVAEAARFSA